jgi:hypothetical protein
VFQDVGVIACMKGVAVAEHDEETLKEGVPVQGGFGGAGAMRQHNRSAARSRIVRDAALRPAVRCAWHSPDDAWAMFRALRRTLAQA